MLAVKLYECFCWCYSTPTATIRETYCLFLFFLALFSLVLLVKKILRKPLFYYSMCVCSFVAGPKNVKKSIFCCIALKPPFVPSSLCHLLFLTFSPPSPWIPQPHHNTVNRRSPDRFTAIVFPLAASVTAEI